MQRNYYQRPMSHKGYLCAATLCALGLVIASGVTGFAVHPGEEPQLRGAGIKEILAQKVTGYSNFGRPLIPTLLSLADRYRLPMGIEKVTRTALHKPMTCGESEGSLADVLNSCVRQVSGYRWAVHDETVDIYGPEEWKSESNLFNYVVPRLYVKGGDLNLANVLLRRAIPEAARPLARPTLPSTPGGSFGDSPGVGGLRPTGTDFIARNQSVRVILNRIVALSRGEVIWMARVPPSELDRNSPRGLWVLVPPGTGTPRDLSALLQGNQR